MVTSYLRAVRRRWYLIAAALLLTLGALALSLHNSITVTSRVVVPFSSDQTSSNFQGIAQSLTVAKAVEFDLRISDESAARLLQQVVVTQEPGSDIYDITIHDTSRPRALRICDAWVTEADALYTKLDTAPSALAYSDAVQQVTTTQQQINSLQQQILAFEYAHPELVNVPVTSITNSPTSDPRGATITSTRRSGSDSTVTQITNHTPGSLQNAIYLANLQQQLTSEQAMFSQLAQAVGTTQTQALQSAQQASVQVLDPAAVVPANIALLTSLAVLVGMLLGLSLVAVWQHFDRSVRTSAPLERAFGSRAVVSIAARPSVRELRRVAPVDWAQPVLPAASTASTASGRAGRWPTVTYAVASLAAALPHARRAPASADDPAELVAHNGHLNGHSTANGAQSDTFDDHNPFDPNDPLDQSTTDGHIS